MSPLPARCPRCDGFIAFSHWERGEPEYACINCGYNMTDPGREPTLIEAAPRRLRKPSHANVAL